MEIAGLNWLDWSIIVLVSLSVIVGVIRGFVREALSLVIWILAFWIAFTFASSVSEHFVKHIANNHLRYGIAFTLLFIVTLIIGGLISFLIAHMVRKTGLGGTDRILGILFGFARGVLIVAVVLLLVIHLAPPVKNQIWWQESKVVPHFSWLVNWIYGLLPQSITKYLDAASNNNGDNNNSSTDNTSQSTTDINAPSGPAEMQSEPIKTEEPATESEPTITPDKSALNDDSTFDDGIAIQSLDSGTAAD